MVDRIRFHDDRLQQKLIAVTIGMGIEYWLEDGLLCTHDRDADVVSCLRDAVRYARFERWHMWRGGSARDPRLFTQYRDYMITHRIPFEEVDEDGGRWFLLSHDSNPYEWGIEMTIQPEV